MSLLCFIYVVLFWHFVEIDGIPLDYTWCTLCYQWFFLFFGYILWRLSFFRMIYRIAFNMDMFLEIIHDGFLRPKTGYGECNCCAHCEPYDHITSVRNPVSFLNKRENLVSSKNISILGLRVFSGRTFAFILRLMCLGYRVEYTMWRTFDFILEPMRVECTQN